MPSSSLHTLVWSSSRLILCSREDASRKKTGRKNTGGRKETVLESISDLQGRRDLQGEFHLTIPASECLLGIADFPGTDAEELAGMVELRMEDVSPFPMDRTYYGWEVLESSENSSRVLYALCARGALDQRHDALRGAGITLHRADVDLAVWLELIRAAEPGEDSRLILLQDEAQHWLIALDRGVPVGIVSLGEWKDQDEGFFLEEVDMALSAVEAEWGALDFTDLRIWTRDEDSFPCLESLQRHVGLPCQVRFISELPPLTEGAMRRAEASARERKLDLSPLSWKEEEAVRLSRKRLVQRLTGLAALWLLVTLSVVGMVKYRDYQLRKLRQELAGQETPVREIRELSDRVRSLSQFTDRKTSALEVLRILAEAAPGSGRVVLRDIQYRKEEGVTISGEASGDFFLFQETLSESPILRVEDFDTREVRGTTEFRIVGRWRWEEDEG